MNLKLPLGNKYKDVDARDVYRLSRFGYTQAEIARKLDVSQTLLSRKLNQSLELMSARHRGLREYELSKSARSQK